ncbi:hypothetical protein B0H11DRAFT_2242588 [Mycena galericulata]|nr:hypothetical protein B0H11DRAFT_2242588 [Mycena galericulata]
MSLWTVINSSAQTGDDLTNHAIEQGFRAGSNDFRAPLIGFNGNEWIKQAQFPYCRSENSHNGILSRLTFRALDHLLLPGRKVFVFDGLQCISDERLRKIRRVFSCMAPAEAEAELAQMNRHNMISAVFTDIFDSLALGASSVIRTGPTGGSSFVIHNAQAIQDASLTRGGLILLVLLAGGDNNKGITGCGKGIALSLARRGFGDALLVAVETQLDDGLLEHIAEWKAALVHELEFDPDRIRGRRYPDLARRMADDATFPDLEILRFYAAPLTSWSHGKAGPPPFEFNAMNLPRFAAFCEASFSWGMYPKVVKLLQKFLYPAACIQDHRSLESLRNDERFEDSDEHVCFCALTEIVKHRQQAPSAYLVRVTTTRLDARIQTGLVRSPLPLSSAPKKTRTLWVPSPLLEYALPNMVQDFQLHVAHRHLAHT